jgi:hypothetical protein
MYDVLGGILVVEVAQVCRAAFRGVLIADLEVDVINGNIRRG